MIKKIFFVVVLINCATNFSVNAGIGLSDSSLIKIDKGSIPVIDGKISEHEWSDAYVIKLSDTSHIYLKHDEFNLYIARDSKIGNVHFIINNRMYVFHASYSLGMAVYDYNDTHKLWACSERYFWEMRSNFVRRASESELKERINTYMMENGWVASTVPMSDEEHNEMVISLNKLGVNPIRNEINEEIIISNVLIDQDDNYWPIKVQSDSPINRISHGWCPDIVEFDYSNWGSILLNF